MHPAAKELRERWHAGAPPKLEALIFEVQAPPHTHGDGSMLVIWDQGEPGNGHRPATRGQWLKTDWKGRRLGGIMVTIQPIRWRFPVEEQFVEYPKE